MEEIAEARLSQRGVLTLPKKIRERYGLEPGDGISVIDANGVIVLVPGRLRIDAAADRLARKLKRRGQTLDSMLSALREQRQRHGGKG